MVKYINYDGKKYPVKIGYRVLKNLQKDGIELDHAKDDLSVYESLLYYALQAGAKAGGEECSLQKEDMEDVLDEVFFEFVGMIPDFFQHLGIPSTPMGGQMSNLQEGK